MIRFRLAEQIEKKQFKESRRVTLQEVAKPSNVNRMTLSKILNHKGLSTGTNTLNPLCACLGCQIEYFVEHIPAAPSKS